MKIMKWEYVYDDNRACCCFSSKLNIDTPIKYIAKVWKNESTGLWCGACNLINNGNEISGFMLSDQIIVFIEEQVRAFLYRTWRGLQPLQREFETYDDASELT